MELKDVLPDDVQPGDYICINDKLTKIVAVYPKGIVVDIDGKKLFVQNAWSRAGVRYKREVDEHPHGLIPDGYGSVIRVDGDIYVKRYPCWLKPLADTYNHHEEMQQIVDRRGFEVLWPKPAVKITDEMVERGAAALGYELTQHAFFAIPAPMQKDLREKTKKVLEAALEGCEQ